MNSEKRKVIAFHTSGDSFTYERKMNEEVVVLVGPEGGWSDKEIELFRGRKYLIVKLSTPVLRAETAAIAITSVILAQ